MGCDVNQLTGATVALVSIHAPVWGATNFLDLQMHIKKVSIHAPVWGATFSRIHRGVSKSFNPRTRVGCDSLPSDTPKKCGFQSTHPCGVRLAKQGELTSNVCFNPRTRVGCDASLFSLPIKVKGFNPRTRVGCDTTDLITAKLVVFQSTHPCGVRPYHL